MKVFVSDRGMGKTTHLIKESAKTKAVIICFSFEHKQWVKQRAKWMEVEIPEPVIYHELLKNADGMDKSGNYLVDEAQILLSSILGVNIAEMTVNVPIDDLTLIIDGGERK